MEYIKYGYKTYLEMMKDLSIEDCVKFVGSNHLYNWKYDDYNSDLIQKIEFVPITKNMLTEIGFTKSDENNYHLILPLDEDLCFRSGISCFFTDNGIVLDVELNYKGGSNNAHILIHYLHEYQHVLRACGLAKEANHIFYEIDKI